MRTACLTIGLVLIASGMLTSGTLARAQGNPIQEHLVHVLDNFKDTPNQWGLLPAAFAEAKIAIEHAGLAAKAANNLDAMKLHAGHVIHAVDPTVEMKGPGLGYGVKRAAAGVAQHIELAAKSEGASKDVRTQAIYVAAYARNVVKWADELVDLAKQIRATTSVKEAASLATDLDTVAQQLTAGMEAVGRFDAQGGLQAVQERLERMKKGAGQ